MSNLLSSFDYFSINIVKESYSKLQIINKIKDLGKIGNESFNFVCC